MFADVDDTAFTAEKEKAGDQVTNAIFNEYFGKISEFWQMEEFKKVFRYLDVDQLQKKNELFYKTIKRSEPCYKFYSITCRKNGLVDIVYGINSNPGYVRKKADSDEDVDGICEHAIIWSLAFDRQGLHVVRQTMAD